MKVYAFPGQGSQKKGMGAALFDEFPEYTSQADAILGYSIKTLCVDDPERQLAQTEFTQPALYVVGCLSYLKQKQSDADSHQPVPDYLIGHSLGEFCALFAAGAFDFKTGLRLVKKRGQLMAAASGGGMAAVLNIDSIKIREVIANNQLSDIDVANYNSSAQTVIAGPKDSLAAAQPYFEAAGARFIALNVSAAFHSRYMRAIADEFAQFLREFSYQPLTTPVIANTTARPYDANNIIKHLTEQLYCSVRWEDSVCYLMGQGNVEFTELGPGKVLTKLVDFIMENSQPSVGNSQHSEENSLSSVESAASSRSDDRVKNNATQAENLGDKSFREEYNIKYAYYAGAMYKGIASKELVVRMGQKGLLAFLGTGGLRHDVVEESIRYIQQHLANNEAYGVNFLHVPGDIEGEISLIDRYLDLNVPVIEASAFTHVTPALVKYKLKGITRLPNGEVSAPNKIIAKISRPELARAFLSPAAPEILQQLVETHHITAQEAELAAYIPVANDICAESNSGGHTDGAVAQVLLPTMARMAKSLRDEFGYSHKVRVGAAGGLGTPESIAAAFLMGADFVVTGSINQCTVEAGTSERVKDMLQVMNIQDTAFAPAGDMFELGAQVQVLKKGVFFPARANKLYELWKGFSSWDAIDQNTRNQIEKKYFGRTFDDVWAETQQYYSRANPEEVARAQASPKHKMALVFKWYFIHTTRLALEGDVSQSVNYQVHTGPAMGAFNQWLKDDPVLNDWKNRHVDDIAEKLMQEASMVLGQFVGN